MTDKLDDSTTRARNLKANRRDKICAMELSDRRSYELHRLVAEKVRREPDRVLAIAARNLARYREARGDHRYYRRWTEIIAAGPNRVVEVLLDEGEDGQVLRSTSPFAGVLDDAERLSALNALPRGDKGE